MDHQLDFETYLDIRRAEHYDRHSLASFMSEVMVLLLTTALMWNKFDSNQLLIWLFIALIPSTLSIPTKYFINLDSPSFTMKKWLISRLILTFFIGLSWGMMPVFFFVYDDIWYIAIMVAIYTGYVSGALAVSATFQSMLVCFVLSITIPFTGAMFYYGGEVYSAIGGLCIFYIIAILYVSGDSTKLFIESMRRQYENEILVAQLANEKQAVEQAVKAKDRFLASASHDLRQPLNAMRLFVEALVPMQRETLGTEILAKLRKSLKSLNSMLHSLLDISKLDAKVIDNKPTHVALKIMVAQLCDEYKEKAPEIEFEFDVSEDTTVFVDANILHRILRNLIDNAVKYTTQGKISVLAKPYGDKNLSIYIIDTGIGIPEDKLSIVFDEYEQLHNPERNREKGLGLGLSIVKRLCSIANIDLELRSKLGVGTEVRLLMINGMPLSEELPASNTDSNLLGKCVLVVDDEEDILLAMQHLLSGWGCQVVAADCTHTALKELSLSQQVPDLIVSDLRLRDGEDGDELIELVRQEYNKDIPSVLVTGDTAPDRIKRIKESGLTVIFKPLEPDDLYQALIILSDT